MSDLGRRLSNEEAAKVARIASGVTLEKGETESRTVQVGSSTYVVHSLGRELPDN
jgi:hypothetical protein